MAREKEVLAVVDGLYGAAAGERSWTDAMEGVRLLQDAAASVLFDMNRKIGAIQEWIGPGADSWKDEYINHINAINPRMHAALQRPAGQLLTDHMLMTEREMDRSEFYEWLQRAAGVRYFIGSRIADDGDLSSFTTVEFTPKHGHATADQTRLFQQVSRHVCNAWQMRPTRAAPPATVLHATDEFVPWAIIAIDGLGQIIDMNRAAENLILSFDGIFVRNHHLHAFRGADERSLQLAIANAVRGSRDAFAESRFALTVGRSNRRASLSIQIASCYRNGPGLAGYPAAMIYITEPDRDLAPSERTLSNLFGLSQQEAKLALLLAKGHDVASGAKAMEIAKNTARNHLRGIFEKTGVATQAALVRLLLKHLPE